MIHDLGQADLVGSHVRGDHDQPLAMRSRLVIVFGPGNGIDEPQVILPIPILHPIEVLKKLEMTGDHTAGEGRPFRSGRLRAEKIRGIRREIPTQVPREDEGHPDQKWFDELDQKRNAPPEEEQPVLNEEVGQSLAKPVG